jgi:Fungal specific transcription factor domain
MDIADIRDLRQLQALMFMIMYLQSSAKLSVCYAYIGVALRSALRLGLHRCFNENFSPIEVEMRKRVFWVIRKMDTYVGALLGLPHAISDDQIDQEYPAPVDDEFITETAILPMPDGRISVMEAGNAHTKLVSILAKIVQYIYPVKSTRKIDVNGNRINTYSVSYSKIMEIEQDLRAWHDELPMSLKPGGDAPREILRFVYGLSTNHAND